MEQIYPVTSNFGKKKIGELKIFNESNLPDRADYHFAVSGIIRTKEEYGRPKSNKLKQRFELEEVSLVGEPAPYEYHHKWSFWDESFELQLFGIIITITIVVLLIAPLFGQ